MMDVPAIFASVSSTSLMCALDDSFSSQPLIFLRLFSDEKTEKQKRNVNNVVSHYSMTSQEQ